MSENSTKILESHVKDSKSFDEGMKYIKKNIGENQRKSINDFFDEYFLKHPELKRSTVINESGLSRTYAHEILNGTKKASRDRIIALCFAAGMNQDETDHALIFSENNPLYAKDGRDALIMLAINHKDDPESSVKTVSDLDWHLYNNGYKILGLIKDQ